MIPVANSNDTAPITWWGRVPVYSVSLLVLAHCAAFVVVALAAPLGYRPLISHMVFSTSDLLGALQVWQVFTYAFVPSLTLWFLVEMAMLYFFGQEVEKFIGRNAFLTLYALLVMLPPLFLTSAAILGIPSQLAGAGFVHFSIFVAFAAIAPGALIFFGIPAKWIALGFFVFYTLVLISSMAWASLATLFIDVGIALFFLRACGVRSLQFGLPTRLPRRSLPGTGPVRTVPAAFSRPKSRKPAKKDPVQGIDPILEKISRSGLQSLTEAERLKLERARAALLEQERSE